MTKPFIFTNIMDFTQVPDERLGACLRDFARVVPAIRAAMAEDNSIGKHPQIEFKWADDGSDDSIHLNDMPDEIDITLPTEPPIVVKNLFMQGLKIVSFPVIETETGYVIEPFDKEKFQTFGLPSDFDSELSIVLTGGSLRGLYYQSDPPQQNLFMCLTGSVMIVAVDLREWSNTFGMHYALELRAGSGKAFLIGSGFAFGIAVTNAETSLVSCLSAGKSNEENSSTILWCDEELGIPWSFPRAPIMSVSDMTAQSFAKFKQNNPFNEDNCNS